jgi:hypothetical protein
VDLPVPSPPSKVMNLPCMSEITAGLVCLWALYAFEIRWLLRFITTKSKGGWRLSRAI